MVESRCLLCGVSYPVRGSLALYAEAFCSPACERFFAAHVLDYYRTFSDSKAETLLLSNHEKRPDLPQVEFGDGVARPNGRDGNGGQASTPRLIEWEPPDLLLMGNQQN